MKSKKIPLHLNLHRQKICTISANNLIDMDYMRFVISKYFESSTESKEKYFKIYAESIKKIKSVFPLFLHYLDFLISNQSELHGNDNYFENCLEIISICEIILRFNSDCAFRTFLFSFESITINFKDMLKFLQKKLGFKCTSENNILDFFGADYFSLSYVNKKSIPNNLDDISSDQRMIVNLSMLLTVSYFKEDSFPILKEIYDDKVSNNINTHGNKLDIFKNIFESLTDIFCSPEYNADLVMEVPSEFQSNSEDGLSPKAIPFSNYSKFLFIFETFLDEKTKMLLYPLEFFRDFLKEAEKNNNFSSYLLSEPAFKNIELGLEIKKIEKHIKNLEQTTNEIKEDYFKKIKQTVSDYEDCETKESIDDTAKKITDLFSQSSKNINRFSKLLSNINKAKSPIEVYCIIQWLNTMDSKITNHFIDIFLSKNYYIIDNDENKNSTYHLHDELNKPGLSLEQIENFAKIIANSDKIYDFSFQLIKCENDNNEWVKNFYSIIRLYINTK